jgi:hypothetical protein
MNNLFVQSCATKAGGKGIGGNLKERATVVPFQYSDDNYDHLYDEVIDEDEKRIENSDSNKRVKVGRGRVDLISGGPSPPNYDGMTAAEADNAKKRYSIDLQKFREELGCGHSTPPPQMGLSLMPSVGTLEGGYVRNVPLPRVP